MTITIIIILAGCPYFVNLDIPTRLAALADYLECHKVPVIQTIHISNRQPDNQKRILRSF